MTNQELIDKALSELHVLGSGESADATDSADAMDILNQMMAAWAVSDKDIQFFPQDTLGDTTPVPIWAEEAVISNLAIKLAPTFEAEVTPVLVQKASEGETVVARSVINIKLTNTDNSHLPLGGGFKRGRSILIDQ